MKYNFIIPYRNRREHLDEFIRRFSEIMKQNSELDIEFFIIHQMNGDDFNKGALLNIGFLEVCKIRPDGLFVFHDVDIYPIYWGSIKYDINKNTVGHPIGSKNTDFGGICCFWKEEFEKINGFPNYYGWGIEDVTIMYRVMKYNIPIDENNIVSFNDNKKCYLPKYYKNLEKEKRTAEINTLLHNEEQNTNIIKNGLSSLEYNILFEMELVPKFKVINVDFKLKEN
jgi:beta-1,4-galactosyltransferase 1